MLPQDRQVRLAYDQGMTTPHDTKAKSRGPNFWLISISIAALILLVYSLTAPLSRMPSPAAWQTNSAGWEMPLPAQVVVAGIAADRVLYLQAGNDLRIDLRTLVIEKHPAAPELRIVAIALRVEPGRYSPREPQAMEGVLTSTRPVLLRTTTTFTIHDGVGCLQEGHCSYWLELTLREPNERITVEHSARIKIPQRPVVINQKK